MPTVTVLVGAENDALEIFTRFEARDPEVADAFYRHLENCLTQLSEHPESAPVYEGQIRRLVMRSYPFGIFFAVAGVRILIHAILDLRQDPESIRRRLGFER